MTQPIVQHVDLKQLAMRVGGTGNLRYVDFSEVTWEDARRVLAAEEELLDSGFDPDDDEDDGLAIAEFEADTFGLEPGVASSVLALSVAKHWTLSSCNGWPGHFEDHALVVFKCRPKHVPGLLELARQSGCGLENGHSGLLLLYANHVRDLMSFAKALIQSKTESIGKGR